MMPELEKLELVFDANKWDKAAPGGLQHLQSLREIEAVRSAYFSRDKRRTSAIKIYMDANDKAKAKQIMGVFQKAADGHPTCPTFIFNPPE